MKYMVIDPTRWKIKSSSGPARSYLKGEGTANYNGTTELCYFLFTVLDFLDSSTAPDKVRVKIWSKATGQVIYDTQKDAGGVSAPDDAMPTTATGSPSTVVFVQSKS
jgi:hypothetical protein